MRLSFTAMVIADFSLFWGKESSGDWGFRGDGPVFDDGVVTKISLMGVLAAASESVVVLGFVLGGQSGARGTSQLSLGRKIVFERRVLTR